MTTSAPGESTLNSLLGNRVSVLKKILIFMGLKTKPSSLEEKVTDVIEEQEELGYLMGVQERIMLYNLLAIGSIVVGDIMVKRGDIVAVNETILLSDLKDLIIKTGHTRIPVYKESLDKIIGFIHAKDLINFEGENNDYQDIIRKVIFIPKSMRAIDLLDQMRVMSSHIAIVVDEYGGTDGIVTMEDLVERIIGDIKDEYDNHEIVKEDIGIIKRGSHIYEVSGKVSIKTLEEKFGIKINAEDMEEEFTTIGGLVLYLSDSIPEIGTVINYNDLEIKVIDGDKRRIKRVIITLNNYHNADEE